MPSLTTTATNDQHQPDQPTRTIIKPEANLLRLPFFALTTKGLKLLDGFKWAATITRGGKKHDVSLTVTRNVATLYPGPLARKAHYAFTSIATERGFPLDNPITWSWRDLTRRMRIQYSGQIVRELKSAIEATAGLMIRSKRALWSKADDKPISTKLGQSTHLYANIVFIDDKLPDGSPADTNYLWFSEWYLNNLNARYYAYLDYDLWQHLDSQSSIASRIYELSLSKFRRTSVLNVNYSTLAQLLPVRPIQYPSHARRQLAPAFAIATRERIIKQPTWHSSKTDPIGRLFIPAGSRLADTPQPMLTDQETITDMTVKEIRSKPEAELVRDFYARWQKVQQAASAIGLIELRSPSDKELQQARELINRYGLTNARKFLTAAIDRMRHKFPDAMRFGASLDYIAEVAHEHAALAQRRRELTHQTRLSQQERQADAARQTAEHHRHTELEQAWQQLTDQQRDDIRSAVLAANPVLERQYRKHPDSFIVLELCLDEMTRRHPH